MLESMITRQRPNRSGGGGGCRNTVFDGTDALMLSGETAIGQYAVNGDDDGVDRGSRGRRAAYEISCSRSGRASVPDKRREAIALAGSEAADATNAAAMVAATRLRQHRDARLAPAAASTHLAGRDAQGANVTDAPLVWGVVPVLVGEVADLDTLVSRGVRRRSTSGSRDRETRWWSRRASRSAGQYKLLKVVRVE